jgi:hypothetical protein
MEAMKLIHIFYKFFSLQSVAGNGTVLMPVATAIRLLIFYPRELSSPNLSEEES